MTRKQQTSLFNDMDNTSSQTVAADVATNGKAATQENTARSVALKKQRKLKTTGSVATAAEIAEIEKAESAAQPAPERKIRENHENRAPANGTKPVFRSSSLEEMHNALVLGLKKYFSKNHFKRGVVGVSGGVDSALVLKLAVDALGAENVTAIIMPELGLSSPENVEHAKVLCEYFGVTVFYQPINSFIMDFSTPPWKPSQLAQTNTKARIRALLLYSYANTENALVLGTSNRSEILLGYGTKYGDLAADIEVIGDLFKTEVVRLADHVGLPPEIVHKPPTAELTQGQTDEADLGATYYDLDKVLMRIEEGPAGCIDRGLSMPLVQLVFRRVEENKHKSQMPPVIKVQ